MMQSTSSTRSALRGRHCQCGGCGECFNSMPAFDKHRTGAHGVDRRCASTRGVLDEIRPVGVNFFASKSVF